MQPHQLLNKLESFLDKPLSKTLRANILQNKLFREVAAKANTDNENDLIYAAIKGIEIIKGWMGSCPNCGGRMHSRSGVNFEHQQICTVCYHIEG